MFVGVVDRDVVGGGPIAGITDLVGELMLAALAEPTGACQAE